MKWGHYLAISTQSSLKQIQRIHIFMALLFSCIGSALVQTALTTALPPLMKSLSISANTGQWLTSIYTLAMGIMIPVTPFLIKRFSTKGLFFTTTFTFILGLLLSAIAPNFTILLIGRVLQAFGSGIFLSLTQVVILQIFPQNKIGTYMGIYGLAVGGVPVFAPTLAGVLVDRLGWRSIFIITLILSVLVLVYALFTFKNISNKESANFDIVSVVLSTVGFGGLLLGLQNIGSGQVMTIYSIVPIIIGVIALILFIHRQLTSPTPFLNLTPFKNKAFVLSVLGSIVLYAVMMAGSIIIPIYLQSIRGYSATISGLVTLPGSLVMMIVSPLAGRIYDRVNIKPLFMGGSIALFLSCLGLTFLSNQISIVYISFIFAFRMLAIGLMMMSLVTWGMAGIPRELTSHGSAIITSLRTIAGAVSSAVFVSIMTAAGNGTLSTHGVNVTFMDLSVVAAVAVILAIVTLFVIPTQRLK